MKIKVSKGPEGEQSIYLDYLFERFEKSLEYFIYDPTVKESTKLSFESGSGAVFGLFFLIVSAWLFVCAKGGRGRSNNAASAAAAKFGGLALGCSEADFLHHPIISGILASFLRMSAQFGNFSWNEFNGPDLGQILVKVVNF